MQTSKIAERHGFRIIHGIVDSIWVQKKGAKMEDLEGSKQKVIVQLAEDLERNGMVTEMIAEEVTNALEGYGVTKRYINECLDKKYKRKLQNIEQEELSAGARNDDKNVPEQMVEVANTGQQEAVPTTTTTAKPEELQKRLEEANNKIKELQLLQQTKPVPLAVAVPDVQHLKEQLEQKNNQITKLESESGITKDIKVNDSMKKDFTLTVEKYNNIIQERVQEDDGKSTFKFFVVNKTGYYIPIKFFIDFEVTLDEKRLA